MELVFSTSKHYCVVRLWAALIASLVAIVAVSSAHASDRWQEAGDGAVAILPLPQKASGISGGSLFCTEQRWSFVFRIEPGAVPAGWKSPAKITVGAMVFEGTAVESHGSLGMAVPSDILEPLKEASRMGFMAGAVSANFSLNYSSAVIDAIAPRCSQIDMSDHVLVTLSEASPDIETGRILLADEAQLFRAETGKEPTYAAARLDFAGDKRLLFASLCGSASYYGRSGCALFGHAAEGPAGEWRVVFNTEGLRLYTDPNAANGGWPNLVTLPLAGGTEPDHWVWNGSEYEIVDLLIAADKQDADGEAGDSAD